MDRQPPGPLELGHFERQLIDLLSDLVTAVEGVGCELSDIQRTLALNRLEDARLTREEGGGNLR
jgi:hypothetical protein